MTPERRRRCARWLAAGFTPQEFRAAVRRAAATPFLTGDSTRGWQASFDWLIGNRRNVPKVLEGEYEPHVRPRSAKSRAEGRGLADLYAGLGPRAADCGVRVNPAALERIRARQTSLSRKNAVMSTAFFGSTTAELRGKADRREKGRDDHALVAPDHTIAAGQRERGAGAQPRASPAAPK